MQSLVNQVLIESSKDKMTQDIYNLKWNHFNGNLDFNLKELLFGNKLKRYSTQKLKFVESYIFIFYLSRCFSFFSKMFLHLPAAFPAQKCGSGGQYLRLQWPVFGAPKASIQGSEASILGSKASTSRSIAP